jgi:hypothetical protein
MVFLADEDNGATITQLAASVNKFFLWLSCSTRQTLSSCVELYRLEQMVIESQAFILTPESFD